jgi:23S rRNA (adenine(2503)-C(2))-methyltransferase
MAEEPVPQRPQHAESMKRRVLTPLPLFDEEIVLEEFAREGIKPSHAYRMWRALLQGRVASVREIPDLPRALHELVERKFAITTSSVEKVTTSADESTSKLLIRLQDGQLIETVVMRYGAVELVDFPKDKLQRDEEGKTVFKSSKRATVCLSSQVGCQMGCTFCATGTMGLATNLLAGEILEQLYHANQVEPIRNVVFMGMGEPLDNYDAVISAIRAMTDVQRFSLSPHRISVSTVGVVPRLRRLAHDARGISLALSLHAPNQKLRTEIVPSGKGWPIEKVMAAMDEFVAAQNEYTSRQNMVFIEYVLIANVNSSDDVAKELGELLGTRSVMLNVIPYNPTDVPHDYQPPSPDVVDRFCEIVRSHGVRVTQRQKLGQDVDAACGQLVINATKAKAAAAGSAGSCAAPEMGGGHASAGVGAGVADIEDVLKRKGKDAPELRNRRAAAAKKTVTFDKDSADAGSAGAIEAPTAAGTSRSPLWLLVVLLVAVYVYLRLAGLL